MLPAKFGSIWPSSFRGEDFFNIKEVHKRHVMLQRADNVINIHSARLGENTPLDTYI
jgi:hypothetical protein